MSFRKRNVALGSPRTGDTEQTAIKKPQLPGTRPSTLDGRPVTSTGTSTLDGLLAGHGGLALGCSLLIEENGTTDYAGALLKFYAAEGLLQGHHVHVIGLPEQWGRELPGAVAENDTTAMSNEKGDKMKIAWRYESLGQHGATAGQRDSRRAPASTTTRSSEPSPTDRPTPFNHNFDLTKRLVHPSSSQITFYPLSPSPTQSPFTKVISQLTSTLTDAPNTLYRLLIPSLLSPALYPPHASQPTHLLPFLHSLRSLLSTQRLTILTSLPTTLRPRSGGLTRWIEILHDGVLELSPFPHSAVPIAPQAPSTSTDNKGGSEELPQGLLRIHKLPILHERGVGNAGYEEDWTFSLSRRRLIARPFNLPPVEGDRDPQEGQGSGGGEKGKGKEGLEF